MAQLWEKAGGPRGVLNVVTTPRELVGEVGGVLSRHPDVRKISFTGSTVVGKQLLSQAADTVKRTSMELGGNAPFVVRPIKCRYLCGHLCIPIRYVVRMKEGLGTLGRDQCYISHGYVLYDTGTFCRV